jgi:hypothetical protein
MKHSSINCNIHDDPNFRNLAPETKILYYYLLAHNNIHLTGLYRVSPAIMAHSSTLSESQVKSSLSELESVGMVRYDYASESVFLPKYFKEQLANQKVSKLTKAADNRVKSIARYFTENSSIPFWGEFMHLHKDALSRIFADLPEELQKLAKAYKPVKKPESGSGNEAEIAAASKPEASPPAASAVHEVPPAQAASACLPVVEKAAASDVAEYEDQNEAANDPRRRMRAWCRDEMASGATEWRGVFKPSDICRDPRFFTVKYQNKLIEDHKLPRDLIVKLRLVIYTAHYAGIEPQYNFCCVRDKEGHVVSLVTGKYPGVCGVFDQVNRNRIENMEKDSYLMAAPFAELPDTNEEEAEAAIAAAFRDF